MNLNTKKTRSIISQVLFLLVVIGLIYYFADNALKNLQKLGIASGFDFLLISASFDLYSPFFEFTSDSTHLKAYFVGLINTLLVSILGIVIATLLGFLLGILRLSNNFLASKISYWIVEFSRNVPVLIWIMIWYFGVILQLPSVRQALDIADLIFLSNRGIYVPAPIFDGNVSLLIASLILGIGFKIWFSKRAQRIHDETGHKQNTFFINTAFLLVPPLLVFFVTNMNLSWDIPLLKGFNFKGGLVLKPEFVGLLLGLSVYTAASIAEIVRAGIESVDKGQKEACCSLNINDKQAMMLVILPQALRAIIPPLINQYLNLTKNSSLAIAIGYMDIVGITGGITLNQTGQALEAIFMVMMTYLVLSLMISFLMNIANKRSLIKER